MIQPQKDWMYPDFNPGGMGLTDKKQGTSTSPSDTQAMGSWVFSGNIINTLKKKKYWQSRGKSIKRVGEREGGPQRKRPRVSIPK